MDKFGSTRLSFYCFFLGAGDLTLWLVSMLCEWSPQSKVGGIVAGHCVRDTLAVVALHHPIIGLQFLLAFPGTAFEFGWSHAWQHHKP